MAIVFRFRTATCWRSALTSTANVSSGLKEDADCGDQGQEKGNHGIRFIIPRHGSGAQV
jgi:hypothetical protein